MSNGTEAISKLVNFMDFSCYKVQCFPTRVPQNCIRGSVRNCLTLRLLMSYIYMEHLFLMFLDHTQRRTTVGRTPLDE